MSENSELKPCAHCGAPAELEQGSDHNGNWFNLGCSRHWRHQRNPDHTNTCIAGRIFYTETEVPLAEAIALWSTRAALPAQPDATALVDALKAARPFVSVNFFPGTAGQVREQIDALLDAWEVRSA